MSRAGTRWHESPGVSAVALALVLVLVGGCDSLKLAQPLRPGAAGEAPAPPLATVWRYDAEAAFGPAPALTADGVLLVGTRQGEVHLIDAADGGRLGKARFGDAVEGAPVLLDGRLLIVPVAGGRHGLVAYDLVAGRARWTRRGDPHLAGLLVADGVLVAAAYDGTLRGLDPFTGVERWMHRPDTLARHFATPVRLPSGLVAVADDRGRVRALDPATARVAWTADLGAPVHESPAAGGALLVVPTTRGFVVALDAATGVEVWRHEAAAGGARFASPALTDAAVVVGASDGVLRRLDRATGTVVWTHRFDGNVAAAPLLAGETVYAGTLDDRLVALALDTGAEVWSADFEGRVKSAPLLVGGLLVVLAEPKHVYAFRPGPSSGVAAR